MNLIIGFYKMKLETLFENKSADFPSEDEWKMA
jgi:hypothetical protein